MIAKFLLSLSIIGIFASLGLLLILFLMFMGIVSIFEFITKGQKK